MTRSAVLGLLLLCMPFEAAGEELAGGDVLEGSAEMGEVSAGEAPPAEEEEEESSPSRWADFELEGAHPFVGISLGGAAMGWWPYGNPVFVDSGFYFGIRGGMLFNRTELAVEIAPVTFVWDFDAKPLLSFHVSIGGLLPLADSVYWPLRFGLGLTAVNTGALKARGGVAGAEDEVYMMGRLDLIGIAYQYGHTLFELSLPSVRYCSEFEQIGLWAWLFNISVSYVI